MRPTHLVALLALSVIWGSAFMLVKVTLEAAPPLTLVAGRFAGAALFLALVLLATRRALPRDGRTWRIFVVLAVANNVWPFTLLTWGQQHIESSLAAILTASMPISTIVLAHFWQEERLSIDRVAGVIVGFAGVVLLVGADLRDITSESTLAQLAVLAGVLGYSFGAVFARKYVQGEDPVVYSGGQMLVGAAIMTPVALGADHPFEMDLSAKIVLAWAALGVVASGLAYVIFYWLIRHVTATQASSVSYLIPITAVLLGALVLDESLAATSLAGLVVIIAGVWLVNGGGQWLRERVQGAPAEARPVGGGD